MDQVIVSIFVGVVRQIPESIHMLWSFFLANPLFCGILIAVPVLGGLTSGRRVPARSR